MTDRDNPFTNAARGMDYNGINSDELKHNKMTDKKFIQGIRAFKPKQDFIKAELVISLNELIAFCKDNPEFLTEYNGVKQLKIQVKETKDGKPYVDHNDWKPQEKTFTDKKDDLPF